MGEIATEDKRYFEDFDVGDEATSTVARTIGEFDQYVICGMYGTYSNLHMNRPLMENSEWGGALVPGVAQSVIMMGLRKRMPWDLETNALYGFDHVRFVKPVYVGDTVYLETEILDREEYDGDPERGILREKEDLLRTEDGETESGELVATRETLSLVSKRPDE